MMYAYSENFILPVSHDEVVHGKKTLIDKMFGTYEEKFSLMRAFLVYMMTLPGKKLMFMGQEYAQFREWDYENQLEWFMRDFPRHAQMSDFVATLNHVYLSTPPLYEIDDSWDGFTWINADDRDRNTISYIRRDISGAQVYVVINFSASKWENYELPVMHEGKYRALIHSDSAVFGGEQAEELFLKANAADSGEAHLRFDLPPLCGIIFKKVK